MGIRIRDRCGWKTDFSRFSCDLKRGHDGPHHVPSDPSLPTNLSREEQEDWDRRMQGKVLGQRPAPKA